MDSKKWIYDIREIKKYNSEILSLRNGHWLVKDKISILSKYSSFFFDSHLDSIKTASIKVLSEIHPMFDLEPEERFAAAIYGKNAKYSIELRKGLCETLVFLGSIEQNTVNCDKGKLNATATLTIRELFKNADWKLWASLNDLLPILAEAAPNEFLSSVENTLKQFPCPFDELFSQEGKGGITGANYLTGLYWALETLAWSEEFLSRAILVLAELATHDPGGRWANRPANSISTILLPWLPQTTAPVDKRIASLKGIQRKFPDIAWKTLIRLLPNQHQVSTGGHKPSFRKFVPEDWKNEITTTEYWEQVQGYAAMAVDMVKGNISYVSELVDNLDNIPQPSFNAFLDYLSSDDIVKLPDEQKQAMWETMISFIKKHRRFSDAKWALPADMVNLIEETAKKLEPSKPEILYRHLFTNKDSDFLEKDVDWKTRQEQLNSQRIEALREIYKIKQTESIITLADNVESPFKVGFSFAQMANEANDNELLPSFLNDQESQKLQFIRGYVSIRYQNIGRDWVKGLKITDWPPDKICYLLLLLPFENEIWEMANEFLQKNVGDYWRKITVNPFPTQSNLKLAIENLLKYNRPRLAIDCIAAHLYTKKEFLEELAIEALLTGLIAEEPGGIDGYQVAEIIKLLQDSSSVKEDDLIKIEWSYLPLLNPHNNANPKTLERWLSQKPEFYIDVIKAMYRSKKEDKSEQKTTHFSKEVVENAWKLLHYWRRPPGKMDDGSFSGEALNNWFASVKKETLKSGHFDIAMTHLGHVLFYSGNDLNGLWLQQTVAELLDEKENEAIREGFTSEVYNSRGVHTIDPSGTPEKELAKKWRKNADDIEKLGLVQFATSLKALASSYERDAERIIADYGNDSDERNSKKEKEPE